MILPRLRLGSVRPLYFPFLETVASLAKRLVSADLVQSVRSVPMILRDILPMFVPYALTMAVFCGFVIWNGGIVLGTYATLGGLCL